MPSRTEKALAMYVAVLQPLVQRRAARVRGEGDDRRADRERRAERAAQRERGGERRAEPPAAVVAVVGRGVGASVWRRLWRSSDSRRTARRAAVAIVSAFSRGLPRRRASCTYLSRL